MRDPRPNDYEHDFIYAEANVGSRSTYLDLTTDTGPARADRLLADARSQHPLYGCDRRDIARTCGTPPVIVGKSTN